MPRWRHHRWAWPALVGLFLCVLVQVNHATSGISDPASFLEQAERVRTSDHSQFVHMLEQVHREEPHLTPDERWYLRYLDAWQTAFQGDYVKANIQLQDVIDHSGDVTLAAKASALLMGNLGAGRRYEDAFVLANRLVADLPKIHDKLARFLVLANLSQSLTLAGQHNLAIKYARMMEDDLPPGETLCNPLTRQVTVLYNNKRLTSSSPELQQGIETCVAAGQPIYVGTMRLIMSDLYLQENQPDKTLSLLHQIAPGIRANQYFSHMLGLQVEFAQVYWKLGDDKKARTAALAAVAMSSPDDINEWLREVYKILYEVEKKRGNSATALAYYEHFVAQDKGYLNDLSARALAYQIVQQQTLAKKLETEELSKQNGILRLQRALDAKAVETSQLYITLLVILLTAIALWLFRTMRSQRRFKRMASRDGLTGILNHQHFINEADRVLRLLEKKLDHACLISIDLDHFKQVNDTHGHGMGDTVLRRTVATCQQHLRPTDLFGRLGGEEFGILLHECSRDQGLDIANRIRVAIGTTPIEKDGHGILISASVGLASTDTSGYGLQRLCKEADAALYRAKRAGRNRVIAASGSGGLVDA